LAAKDLAEGQKGVLLTGFIKILVPLVMLIPGIIAFHYFKGGLDRSDFAYPALVRAVMPWWLVGFFVAAFFGTVISHFNSIVNSTATLFALDIYQGMRPKAPEEKVINVGKIASTLFSLASLFVAPLLIYAPDGIFMLVRRFTGFYNIPIIAVVLIGFFAPRVSALPVKISIISHIILYALLIFVFKIERYIHFIHLMGILFVLEVMFLLILGKIYPREIPYVPAWKKPGFTFVPWQYAYVTSAFLIGLLVSVYLTFSKVGLANPEGVSTQYYVYLGCVWGVFCLFCIKDQFFRKVRNNY
jgi:SSS family solute:Na+ symporter